MQMLTEVLALFEPGSPHRSIAASALVLLVSSLFFLIFQAGRKKDKGLPFAGVRSTDFVSLFFGSYKFISHGRDMLDEGYYKYRNKPFQIPTRVGNRVILPAKYLDELKNVPDTKLSFVKDIAQSLSAETSGVAYMGEENAPHMKVCKKQLTANLAKLVDPLTDEAKFALKVEFPEAEDWTAVTVNHVTLRLVARTAARVFVGSELCRNEEWLNASVKYTEDLFASAFLMTLFPKFVHPIAALFLPYRNRIRRHGAVALKYIAPIYAQRLADHEAVIAGEKTKIDDLYTWMVGAARPQHRTAEALTEFQLILSMSAIHTTTLAVVALLYDLTARPEYIEPLREEMEQAIMEDGGELKKSTLGKMMKLDSFMKESHRVNSNLVSFSRTVLQPITLSDGFHLPAGTMLAVPITSINNDPELVENPEVFDGYRYYKLRQQKDQLNKHQFVSTSLAETNFGYGPHACPGRFFAANVIQILAVNFLMKYDMKYPEGEGRPPTWNVGGNTMQDVRKKLLFKKRENAMNVSFL